MPSLCPDALLQIHENHQTGTRGDFRPGAGFYLNYIHNVSPLQGSV